MIFACDFETEIDTIKNFKVRNQRVSVNLEKTYKRSDVVLNPICHVAYYYDDYIVTHTFMQFIIQIQRLKLKSSPSNPLKILYHNLTYDFAIIKEELLYHNFIQVVEADETKIYENLPRKYIKKKYSPTNTFTIVGQDLRQMRFASLKYKDLFIELIDTFQIYSGSLYNFTDSFNVQCVKYEYDWNTHVNGTNYKEILKYCKNDCKGLYQAYHAIIDRLGAEGKTISGITLKIFKEQFLDDKFDQVFPTLSIDSRRLSHYTYNGGTVYANPKFINHIVENVVAVDVNSMYPYVMKEFSFPHGLPRELSSHKRINSKKYQEMVVYIDYEMVNMFPFFRVYSSNYYNELYGIPNENFKSTSVPEKFKGYVAINSIELNLLKKYAKINELTYHEIFEYHVKSFFTEFVETFSKMKINFKELGDLGGVYVSKILLNSLYGKFGQDLTGKNKVYTKEENIFYVGKRKMRENYLLYKQTDLEGIYTPLASAVTAYARQVLLEGAEKIGFENVVYGDTDSLYFIDRELKIIEKFKQHLHQSEFGKWDVDVDYLKHIVRYRMKVLGLKTYCLESDQLQEVRQKDNSISYEKIKHVKCVGLNKKVANNFNISTFVNGAEVKTKKSKLAKGGIHIYDAVYKLRRF